jgi:hypothetical protein
MLKKITEAMKDLVTEANFDCSTTGVSVQAMVSSTGHPVHSASGRVAVSRSPSQAPEPSARLLGAGLEPRFPGGPASARGRLRPLPV